ncbi:MAG: YraN family protein [Rhodospirillales bacterium]|nr:YraN family protein [Rhodospirillales bacterium]
MTEKRRQAYRRGRLAESLCVWMLKLKGYRILVHGYKEKTGEIDIIANRGKLLAFIEVKARQNYQDAAEAISITQQKRIIRSAQAFVMKNPSFVDHDLRFDAMLVLPWRLPHHIKDAWRPDF